ncbi:MAG: transposase [Lentisphaeria bacterium]
MYHLGDKLFSHKKAIEEHFGQQEALIFNLKRTVILYDLTNTFFEGQASKNTLGTFGRSKEKRTDCPLVTMGLVLDGEGFPLASEIFAGNASEPKTLKTMIEQLSCASKFAGEVVVKEVIHDQVIAKRIVDAETGEIRLYCHSQMREKKDQAIETQFTRRFEEKLNTLNAGLSKKGTVKKYEKMLERLDAMKQKYARVSQHYDIEVIADDEKKHARNIMWSRKQGANKKPDLSGVYCLRTNSTDLSEKALWQTYTVLTDVEACFRSMKKAA